MGVLVDLQVRRHMSPRRRGGPAVKYTDAQIVEMRRLHASGVKPSEIQARYGILNKGWLYHVLDYSFRSSPLKPLDPAL